MDSRQWRYEEIQQLIMVSSTEIRILTYEDSKWELGRTGNMFLAKDLAVETYPRWARKLDQLFVAAVPAAESGAEWKATAKLDQGLAGPSGVADDR